VGVLSAAAAIRNPPGLTRGGLYMEAGRGIPEGRAREVGGYTWNKGGAGGGVRGSIYRTRAGHTGGGRALGRAVHSTAAGHAGEKGAWGGGGAP